MKDRTKDNNNHKYQEIHLEKPASEIWIKSASNILIGVTKWLLE
jgi:hypothetical protein